MFDELPPLSWLRAFEATARLGNFTRAAEELNLTPSAVSYQIRALEARLGHKLFERRRRTLVMTRLAQSYLPVVSKAFADIDASTAGVFGRMGGERVTLRCMNSLNMLWLVPRIEAFRARHPDIALSLLSASWAEGGDSALIDLDIRYGEGLWSDGEVIPLMRHGVQPVCAPDLAGGMPALERGPLIEMAGVVDTWRHFFRLHLPETRPPSPDYVVDTSLMALELAERGLGHALVADIFAAPYLESGRLVRSCDRNLEARHGHFIVVPAHSDRNRHGVRAMIDWLGEIATDA
ncbi:LysR substrate-binding domain-containing protein [Limimaricola pyoseonensis]|uniref:LysR family transcriptional regulator, glycine cleavage system transcriptional activator n=1 Tax=Limimaricola pyoseonensis TaxID=521013 RepID=A0A1G7KS95_9RHOB|nr:LysR substrate-binding domain-containing protein [Limimaricola pyoseonensis]SDF40031.1 LysR family transcriptional regulator, glycine cleavage system transcriptional activator [Limimaricola pyoseonensis]